MIHHPEHLVPILDVHVCAIDLVNTLQSERHKLSREARDKLDALANALGAV
jgi:hypothetical protein